MLTPSFAQQVKRGVTTMDADHSVAAIYLTTEQLKNFSNGTDFRTLLHLAENGEKEKAAAYLQ